MRWRVIRMSVMVTMLDATRPGLLPARAFSHPPA